MKKLLLGLLILIGSQSFAAEGDTTQVRVHDKVHMDWNGNYDAIGQFPTANVSYRKVLMKYTLGCPTTGCSDWDYTTSIKVKHFYDNGDSTWVELGRLITPYGSMLTTDWEQEHWYDVTDYVDLLGGTKDLRARYSGWSDGFTVTTDFYFIEGTPPRETKRVMTMYDGSFKYGRPSNPIESHLVPVDFTLDAGETGAEVHYTPTGHSFGGNENCAEFCPKNYYVKMNNSQIAQQLIWDDKCGHNPLYPQGGTWIYDRANWCPGTEGIRYRHDLTPHLISGQNTIDIDMQPFVHDANGSGDPQYTVYSALITYGDWNFQYDAEIESILAPNNDFNYNRMNPICSRPKVSIRNTGEQDLTSLDIYYGSTGGNMYKHTWTGNLKSLESAEVELPAQNWLLNGNAQNQFRVVIEQPSGQPDEYNQNNELFSTFEHPDVVDSELLVQYRTNAAGNETSWQIEDLAGNVVYTSPALQPNTTYAETLSLDTGCYRFVLADSDCDGLSFFANNDGNGYARIRSAVQTAFYKFFTANFGCEERYTFTVGYSTSQTDTTGILPAVGSSPNWPTGREELTLENQLEIYPNPFNDYLQFDLFLAQPQDLSVAVYNMQGKLVKQHRQAQAFTGSFRINLNELPAGMYVVQTKGNGVSMARKFMKR